MAVYKGLPTNPGFNTGIKDDTVTFKIICIPRKTINPPIAKDIYYLAGSGTKTFDINGIFTATPSTTEVWTFRLMDGLAMPLKEFDPFNFSPIPIRT